MRRAGGESGGGGGGKGAMAWEVRFLEGCGRFVGTGFAAGEERLRRIAAQARRGQVWRRDNAGTVALFVRIRPRLAHFNHRQILVSLLAARRRRRGWGLGWMSILATRIPDAGC